MKLPHMAAQLEYTVLGTGIQRIRGRRQTEKTPVSVIKNWSHRMDGSQALGGRGEVWLPAPPRSSAPRPWVTSARCGVFSPLPV